MLSLSPMKWPRHHLTNCRDLGRWKVLNSSILGMQEAMKMRWGDSKNLQKRDRSSCVSSLEHVALYGLKTRSSGVKCCQTLRNEIETREHIPWENDSYSQKRSPINSRQKVKQKLTTVVELPRRSAKWYLGGLPLRIFPWENDIIPNPQNTCPCKKQNWPEALV